MNVIYLYTQLYNYHMIVFIYRHRARGQMLPTQEAFDFFPHLHVYLPEWSEMCVEWVVQSCPLTCASCFFNALWDGPNLKTRVQRQEKTWQLQIMWKTSQPKRGKGFYFISFLFQDCFARTSVLKPPTNRDSCTWTPDDLWPVAPPCTRTGLRLCRIARGCHNRLQFIDDGTLGLFCHSSVPQMCEEEEEWGRPSAFLFSPDKYGRG